MSTRTNWIRIFLLSLFLWTVRRINYGFAPVDTLKEEKMPVRRSDYPIRREIRSLRNAAMSESPHTTAVVSMQDGANGAPSPVAAARRNLSMLAGLLAAVQVLAVLGLALAAGYGTQADSPALDSQILWLLAILAILAVTAGAVLLVWAVRARWGQRGIWAMLSRAADAQDAQTCLECLEPVAVGENVSPAARGWNRVVAAIDSLRDGAFETVSAGELGAFLCSYDAQRLLGILDALVDGVLVADNAGLIVLANRSGEGKLGRPLGEFIGRPITEIFAVSPARELLEGYLTNAGGADCTFDLVVTAQGDMLGVGPLGQLHLPDEHDASEGAAIGLKDIADAAQSGGTILRVVCHKLGGDDENSELLVCLRDVTQQKLSEASRDAFIASVSHELRSPLTNIRAYAETLLSDMILDASAQKDAFNVINEETDRLLRLVNDILDLSRMETGSLTLDRGEVVLDRLVRQCVQDVKGLAAAAQITLETNYHPKLPNILADREKLAVVINNILTNAIKYTPAEGTVFVETNVDDRSILIKVTDTGYGLAPEDVDRIFQKFYRVDRPETARIEGTGLGLSICKEIVMLHGGAIHVVSELNKGTEMQIRLPFKQIGPVLGPAALASQT